jgi:uroporphyrinogen decarboxylase
MVGELSPAERLLRACRGEPVDRPPVWLMRQAGRYLPEYRRVREGLAFLEMCRDVERAVEVSLQPLRLVGTEAVILFSDIFVPVVGMGVDLEFRPGPVVAEPIRTREQVEALRVPDPRDSVPFVLEILRRLRGELAAAEVPLLGFAGAPFTLAAYLVEGRRGREFEAVRRLVQNGSQVLRSLLERLAELVTGYLRAQVEAGAQALQLFDSWVGALDELDYRELVLPHVRRIFDALADLDVPKIHFGTDTEHLLTAQRETGDSMIGVDWRTPLDET